MNSRKTKDTPEISIILSCRNEEAALGYCLKQIKEVIKKHQLSAEIIVSDSSSDDSPNIARRYEAVKFIGKNPQKYKKACLRQAQKFDKKVFIGEIKKEIANYYN